MCVIRSYNHMYVYVPCNVMSLSAQTRTGGLVVCGCVCVGWSIQDIVVVCMILLGSRSPSVSANQHTYVHHGGKREGIHPLA